MYLVAEETRAPEKPSGLLHRRQRKSHHATSPFKFSIQNVRLEKNLPGRNSSTRLGELASGNCRKCGGNRGTANCKLSKTDNENRKSKNTKSETEKTEIGKSEQQKIQNRKSEQQKIRNRKYQKMKIGESEKGNGKSEREREREREKPTFS